MPNLAYFARAKYNNVWLPAKTRLLIRFKRTFSSIVDPNGLIGLRARGALLLASARTPSVSPVRRLL